MSFDYENNTREAYKDDHVAKTYHDAFASDIGVRSIRFRAVAAREISTVRSLLQRIPHKRIVDIPAGTGKLAPIFAEIGSNVLACDISENMLNVAKTVYSKQNYMNVMFSICDASKLSLCIDGNVDAIVCLRLMHRVPADVRKQMLSEFCKVSKFAVISYGVESVFHRLRRRLRALLLGGGSDALSYESIATIRQELNEKFEILEERDVIPILSQERVFLVQAR